MQEKTLLPHHNGEVGLTRAFGFSETFLVNQKAQFTGAFEIPQRKTNRHNLPSDLPALLNTRDVSTRLW